MLCVDGMNEEEEDVWLFVVVIIFLCDIVVWCVCKEHDNYISIFLNIVVVVVDNKI